MDIYRQRESERDRETERDRDRDRDRETETETERDLSSFELNYLIKYLTLKKTSDSN